MLLCWYYELFAGGGRSWLGMNFRTYMHVYIRERWVNKEISTGSKQKMGKVDNLEQALKSNISYMNWALSCSKTNTMRQLVCVTLRNIFSLFLLWVWLWPRRWSISPFCFSTIVSRFSCLLTIARIMLAAFVWRTWQLGIRNMCKSDLLFSSPTAQM